MGTERPLAAMRRTVGGVTDAVAEFVVSVTTADLTAQVRERVMHSFVDAVGVALAASDNPNVGVVRRCMAPLSPGATTVWCTGEHTASTQAALLNATAAHALDFDDVSEATYGHPSAVLVPVVLALGEQRPSSVGDLVAAYSVGYQVQTALSAGLRIRRHYGRGWHVTGLAGPIGAAAAAARLCGLTAAQTRCALALAVARAGGTTSNFGTGAKPLQAGYAAADGVWAARLATAGLTAGDAAVDGPGGLLAMFDDHDRADAVLDALRAGWAVTTHPVDLKPYPCCSAARCAVDAARQLGPIRTLDRVRRVRVTVEPGGLDALVHPLPRDADQARFSMPFLVAAALIDGDVTLDTLTPQVLRRPELLALASRVRAETAPHPPRGPETWRNAFAVVELTWTDGKAAAARADAPAGDNWPWSQVEAKFTASTSLSSHRWDTPRLLAGLRALADRSDTRFRSPFVAA